MTIHNNLWCCNRYFIFGSSVQKVPNNLENQALQGLHLWIEVEKEKNWYIRLAEKAFVPIGGENPPVFGKIFF